MRQMMNKPEQYETMPDYTADELEQAKKFLGSLVQTLTAGMLGLVVVHEPEGTPGFYAAGAKILSGLNARFPADFLYPRIRTFRDMQKGGYGALEVMGIMGENFQAFLDGNLHGEAPEEEDPEPDEDGLAVSRAELDRARVLLHGNPLVDIALMVMHAAMKADRDEVDIAAAAVAMSEMFTVYGPYRPAFLRNAIVQFQTTKGKGGSANIGAALLELMATFCIKD
jgi:hypothetical protein